MNSKGAPRVISVHAGSDTEQLLDECAGQPGTRTAVVLNIRGDTPALLPEAVAWVERFQAALRDRQIVAPWLVIWHDQATPEQFQPLRDRLQNTNATLVDCQQPASGFLNLSSLEGIKRTLRSHRHFKGGTAQEI